MEFERVQLANDFPTKYGDDGELNERWSEEEAHLLYVAVTRAVCELDVSGCDAVVEALSLQDDASTQSVEQPCQRLSDKAYEALAGFATTHQMSIEETVHMLIKSYEDATNQIPQLALFA